MSAPQKPDNIDANLLLQSTRHWHQRWEVFDGIFTPGRNSVQDLLLNTGVPADLSGARVLDIGAFNCCCSFECERRGAQEVVALDLVWPDDYGFSALKRALGSTRVKYVQGSAYELDPKVIGTFDVVLFFGVLYHLRYPLLAIDQIRKIVRGTAYIETFVIDHRFITNGKDFQELSSFHKVLADTPIWQFYKGEELGGDASNWFGPNICAVKQAFESAGMSVALVREWGDRAGFQARPDGVDTVRPSYEGWSTIVRQGLLLD